MVPRNLITLLQFLHGYLGLGGTLMGMETLRRRSWLAGLMGVVASAPAALLGKCRSDVSAKQAPPVGPPYVPTRYFWMGSQWKEEILTSGSWSPNIFSQNLVLVPPSITLTCSPDSLNSTRLLFTGLRSDGKAFHHVVELKAGLTAEECTRIREEFRRRVEGFLE